MSTPQPAGAGLGGYLERARLLGRRLDVWIEPRRPLRIARAALSGFLENDGMHYAAGMAYYSLLALFQLAVLGVVVLSLAFGTGEARTTVVSLIVAYTPVEAATAEGIIDAVLDARGGASALAIPFLLLGTLGIFEALRRGINRVFQVPEPRTMLGQKLVQLLLLAVLGALVVVAIVIRVAVSIIEGLVDRLALPGGASVAELVGLLVPFVLASAALVVVYRVVPNRPVRLGQVWPSAVLAGAAWTVLQALFSLYATRIANYDSLFGPISSAVSLLVFLFFSSAIVLAGAALAHATVVDAERQAGPLPLD